MTKNEAERIKIQRKTAEFLSAGGEIHTVHHTENHGYNQPTKRTRKEQIEFNRRCNGVL